MTDGTVRDWCDCPCPCRRERRRRHKQMNVLMIIGTLVLAGVMGAFLLYMDRQVSARLTDFGASSSMVP